MAEITENFSEYSAHRHPYELNTYWKFRAIMSSCKQIVLCISYCVFQSLSN